MSASKVFEVVEKFLDEVGAEKQQLKRRIAELEKENEELRAKLYRAAIAAAETAPTQDAVGKRLRANGFGAVVIASSSTEKALTNVAYYNPGRPFEGDLYVRPTTGPTRAANACLRVRYCADTPKMSIEVGLYNRLYHGFELGSDELVEFKPVAEPRMATNATLVVVPIGNAPMNVSFARNLDGQLMMEGCWFALKVDEHTYKIKPVAVNPSGAAFFYTCHTHVTFLSEDNQIV